MTINTRLRYQTSANRLHIYVLLNIPIKLNLSKSYFSEMKVPDKGLDITLVLLTQIMPNALFFFIGPINVLHTDGFKLILTNILRKHSNIEADSQNLRICYTAEAGSEYKVRTQRN